MIEIEKSKFNGNLEAPPFKSYSIRYILLSALIKGESAIENPGKSEDVNDALNVLKASGISYWKENDKILINSNGNLNFRKLYIKASATVLRIAVALASGFPGKKEIYLGETLRKRPIEPELQALEDKGVKFKKYDERLVVDGMVSKKEFEIDGKISSQFVTSLMYLSPLIKDNLTINIKNGIVSKTYFLITVNVFRNIGLNVKIEGNRIDIKYKELKPFREKVPGDFTLSSYFAVMTAISGEKIRIGNLDTKSSEDSKIVEIFREAGVRSNFSENSWVIQGGNIPESIEVNMMDYPDLVPPLTALLANGKGNSILKGLLHLKYKESDRIENLSKILNLYGAKGILKNSDLIIEPAEGRRFYYFCPGDHRMAMTAITLQSKVSGTVDNEFCVNKSYPQFLSDFQGIGGKYHAL